MEKVAYIKELEVPVAFQYPPSRLAMGMGLPIALYAFVILSIQGRSVFSYSDLMVLGGLHLFLLALLFAFINARFPYRVTFRAGSVVFERFFGKPIDLRYEDLEAVLETPYVSVFAIKGGVKLLFLPAQTNRLHDFKKVLHLLYETLQGRT